MSIVVEVKGESCPCSAALAVPIAGNVFAGVRAAMSSYADACKANGSGTSESTLSPARLSAWGSWVVVCGRIAI